MVSGQLVVRRCFQDASPRAKVVPLTVQIPGRDALQTDLGLQRTPAQAEYMLDPCAEI